jgi:hypothetical protein
MLLKFTSNQNKHDVFRSASNAARDFPGRIRHRLNLAEYLHRTAQHRKTRSHIQKAVCSSETSIYILTSPDGFTTQKYINIHPSVRAVKIHSLDCAVAVIGYFITVNTLASMWVTGGSREYRFQFREKHLLVTGLYYLYGGSVFME